MIIRVFCIICLLTLSSVGGGGSFRRSETSWKDQNDSIGFDTVHGIDISHYQGVIRWHRLSPVFKFVIIKASEGNGLRDQMFRRNWDSARGLGLIRGAYHFYRPAATPLSQFRFFSSVVRLQRGDLPPVIDLETPPRSTLTLRRDLTVFISLCQKHYGVKPILYTNRLFYRRHLQGAFDSCVFWIAEYKSHSLDSLFPLWSFWQYTPYGRVAGVNGHVDLNLYRHGEIGLKLLTLP